MRDRRVYACPHCLFQIAPTANTILHDARSMNALATSARALRSTPTQSRASGGVETFESCQGGPGHAFLEPTIRFHGGHTEGIRALAVAMEAELPVDALRRVWTVIDGEPTGPCWELTFAREA